MILTKNFPWKNRFYCITNCFYNLNFVKCKHSYLLLFYCKIMQKNNLSNHNHHHHVRQISKCCKTSEFSDLKAKMSNNQQNVPLTAVDAPSFVYWGHDPGCSSSVPNLGAARRGSAPKRPSRGHSKESNSVGKREKSSNTPKVSSDTTFPILVNSSPACMQNRSVSLLNNGDSTQTFDRLYSQFCSQVLRDLYLFRKEEGNPPETGMQPQNSSEDLAAAKALKDKELVSTLRSWIPTNAFSPLVSDPGMAESGLEFTLMSYNILAQDLLVEHAYLYRNHSPRALLWETRWKNLYQEIISHNPDIFCLQEVQDSHTSKYFSQFNNLGYTSLYKKRTGRRTDGCALYYRKSMFKLVENITVEYNQGFSVLDRDNVAIVAKFAPVKNPKMEFVVATTHLLYNPRRQDIRLAQTQVLLAEVDRIAYKGQSGNKYTPVIITGDFNFEPKSAAYNLIVDGKLQYENLTNRTLMQTDAKYGLNGKMLLPASLGITDNCQHLEVLRRRAANITLPRSEEVKLVHLRHSRRSNSPQIPFDIDDSLFSTGILSHDLQLQSAFLHRVNDDSEGTTNQNGWITVDYIFYSGNFSKQHKKVVDGKLKLLSRYSIPTVSQLLKLENIPNFALGSDHLALLTKFKLEY